MESELFPVEMEFMTFGSDGHLNFGALNGYPSLPLEVPGASGIHNDLFSIYVPLPVTDPLHEQKKQIPSSREELSVVTKQMYKPIGESQEGAGELQVGKDEQVGSEVKHDEEVEHDQAAEGEEGESVEVNLSKQKELIRLAMKRPMSASSSELEKKKRRAKKPMFRIE